MSGNKLLAENTIRRFMKLASVDTMTDNFIKEMKYTADDDVVDPLEEETEVNEEEEVNEEVDALYEEEDELEDEAGIEGDMEMDLDTEEPAVDAEPELGAADMSLTEEEAQLLIDLGSRLSEAMGAGMGEDPEMDAPVEDDVEGLDMSAPEEEEEEEEELMQEALVNEVLKRVTKRIVASKLKNRK